RQGRKRHVIESGQTALQPLDVILQQSDVAIEEAGRVVQLVRNSGGELAERGHLFRVNNLGLKTLKFSPPSRQFGILVLQRFFIATSVAQKCAPFQSSLYAQRQNIEFAGLDQVIRRTHSDGVDYSLRSIDARDHDHRRVGITLDDLAQQL